MINVTSKAIQLNDLETIIGGTPGLQRPKTPEAGIKHVIICPDAPKIPCEDSRRSRPSTPTENYEMQERQLQQQQLYDIHWRNMIKQFNLNDLK